MIRQAATQSRLCLGWAGGQSAGPAPTLESETVYRKKQPAGEITEPDNSEVAATPDASASDSSSRAENPAIATPGVPVPQLEPVPVSAAARGDLNRSQTTYILDRTLSIADDVQLMVSTGSGDINLTRSSGNQIRIHGQIHVSGEAAKDRLARSRQSADPTDRQCDSSRTARTAVTESASATRSRHRRVAPKPYPVRATSSTKALVKCQARTGSGDISANGLQAIRSKDRLGQHHCGTDRWGRCDCRNGLGNIEIKDVRASFAPELVQAISGRSTPSGPWTLETGSGNIELWAGNAPHLDASTGSGSVTTDTKCW